MKARRSRLWSSSTNKHSLPLTEQHLAVDHRDRHRRLAHQQLPNVGMSVDELVLLEVLGTDLVIVVLVVGILCHERVDGPAVVVEEPGLRLVDDHRRGGVRRIHRHLAVPHTRSTDDVTHELGEIVEVVRALCGEVDGLSANGGRDRFGQNHEGTLGRPGRLPYRLVFHNDDSKRDSRPKR